MVQFPLVADPLDFGLPEKIIRARLPGFGVPINMDMNLPTMANAGNFSQMTMSGGRGAPSFEEVDAGATKIVDKGIVGPLEGVRKAVRARDEKGMKREYDKLARALGDPDSFAGIAFDFLANRSMKSLSAHRAAEKIIEAIIMEEDALARQPRLTVGDVLGSPQIARAMGPGLRPEQFKTTPFGQPIDPRALALIPGGGRAPTIDPNLPPDIRPQDLVSYAQGTNKPVARGLVTVAPNPSAALDPSQAARFAAMVPEEARAAFKPSGAMPPELQQGILYADMMVKTFPELATRENVMAWVDKGAKLVKQPDMPGSAGAKRAAAEATIEEAKALNIDTELLLGREKIREQIRGEANRNLYDSQTWTDRVKLQQAQINNYDSLIKERELGAGHWQRRYEISLDMLEKEKQMAKLAQVANDVKSAHESESRAIHIIQALQTVAQNDPTKKDDPKFIKAFDEALRLLGVPLGLKEKKGFFSGSETTEPGVPVPPAPLRVPSIESPASAKKRYEESRKALELSERELEDMLKDLNIRK